MELSLGRNETYADRASPAAPSPDDLLLTNFERGTLHASTWFASLPVAVQREIDAARKVRTVRGGEAVDRSHAPGLYGIASGALTLRLQGGGSPVLDYLPPGSWVLDPSALAGGPPLLCLEAHRRATVAALAPATVRDIMGRHPEAAAALQALSYAGVRRVTSILEDLAGIALRPRLARCLLRLADSFGVEEQEGTRIAIVLNQDAIANMVGACRQRVNLELRALEGEGILQIGRELRVRNRAALAAAA